MNLEVIVQFLSYDGSASNDPADAIKIKSRVQETAITDISRQQLQIADSVTNQTVAVPASNSEYLLIFTDRDISVVINAGDPITLKTRANGTKTPVLYLRGPISTLTVSNASGATANVDFVMANK